MKYILAAAFMFFLSQVYAQVSVTGKLVDPASEKALSRTTVSVYDARDTSLLVCRLSKYEGDFILPGIPLHVPCRMIVYDSGYAVYRKEFTLTEDNNINLGIITLAPDAKTLEEVLVYAERPPVIVHKMTIEFNALIFKYLSGTKVEGLLKKLPGLLFTSDGNVTVNGEKIKGIFLDDMNLIYSLQ